MAILRNPDPRVLTDTGVGNGLAWMRAIEYPEWMAQGLCGQSIEHHPDEWFPVGGPGRSAAERMAKRTAAVKSVCAGCTVREECLMYALEAGERHGVWGGLDEIERRELRRPLKRQGA